MRIFVCPPKPNWVTVENVVEFCLKQEKSNADVTQNQNKGYCLVTNYTHQQKRKAHNENQCGDADKN